MPQPFLDPISPERFRCDLVSEILSFETPCGTGLMTHPSVVKAPSQDGQDGFWLVGTPYDGLDNTIENPCVYFSRDGSKWDIPRGGKNPIVPSPEGAPYNSDPHLEWVNGIFHLWYRRTDDGYDTILHTESIDGVSWTDFDTAVQVPQAAERVLSPSIVKFRGKWRMYTVKFVRPTNQKVIQYRESLSLRGPWGPAIDCAAPMINGRLPWHIDVAECGNGLVMLICDSTSNKGGDLFVSTSTDGHRFRVALEPVISKVTPYGALGTSGRGDARGVRSAG